jgi:hypothetical protein
VRGDELTDAIAEGQDEMLRLLRRIDNRMGITQRGLAVIFERVAPEFPQGGSSTMTRAIP